MRRENQFESGPGRKWTAMVLAMVIAIFGFAEATHSHHGLAADHSPTAPAQHCLICVSAHAAPLIATVIFTPVLARNATLAKAADPQLRSRLVISPTFIRPPPESD